jgi:hypothetical protein
MTGWLLARLRPFRLLSSQATRAMSASPVAASGEELGPMHQSIQTKLAAFFEPAHLDIENER